MSRPKFDSWWVHKKEKNMWNLHRYEEASYYEVEKWLEKALELTPYQKSKMSSENSLRYSRFTFLKRREHKKPNLLWRISSIFFFLYYLTLVILYPFTYIFTGELGYSMKFYDKYVSKWRNKIGF